MRFIYVGPLRARQRYFFHVAKVGVRDGCGYFVLVFTRVRDENVVATVEECRAMRVTFRGSQFRAIVVLCDDATVDFVVLARVHWFCVGARFTRRDRVHARFRATVLVPYNGVDARYLN